MHHMGPSRQTPMPAFISAAADIRGDYRYSLTRVWESGLPMVTYVLLNPSTADAVVLDPTLRRCVRFAIREGFGGMVILNLYAFRTKSPKLMLAAPDPVGPENDRVLSGATGVVIAGWGASARSSRVAEVLPFLPPLHALRVTKSGSPGHPLFVPGDAPLLRWAP